MRPHVATLVMLASTGLLAPPVMATIVSGQVTNAGGSGIVNVDLDFIDRDTDQSIPLVNDDTDPLGFYAVSVPPGDYDIRFKPPQGVAYVGVELRGERVEGGSMGLDQELDSGWLVSGRVIDSGAFPVAQLDLDVIDLIDGGPIFTAHDNTNASGNFQIVLPTGNFDVQFEPAVGSSLVPKSLTNLNIAANTALGDITLMQGVHLSGTIANPAAQPLQSVEVQTLDPFTGQEIFNIRNTTDPLGQYDLVVAPGAYDLLLIPPRGASVLPRLIGGVSLQSDLGLPLIELDAGVVASGLVLEPSSNPAEGTDLDFEDELSGSESFTPKDNADQAGLYSIAVTPGTYDVSFNPPTATGFAAKSLSNVSLFTSTTLPTVQLEVGHLVSGTVKNGSGVAQAGVDLDFLISIGGQEIVTSADNTNALGAFSVLVPSGTYDVEFNPVTGSGLGQTTLTNVSVSGNLSLGTITLPGASAASVGGITPNNGSAGGGSPVTITGTGFAPGVKVRLGGVELTGVTLLNPTAIQAVTRAHPVGTVSVEVINPGAAAFVLPTSFTFTAPVSSPVLTVERTGPLATDILLVWSSTGQPSYTVFRSDDAAALAESPQIIDVVPETSLRDDGAASSVTHDILFYVVE